MHAVPLAFLRLLLPGSAAAAAGGAGGAAGAAAGGAPAALRERRQRLRAFLLDALGRLRLTEVFEILIEYPDSLPAVRELGTCLAGTSLAPALAASFKECLQRRLLHAGAATPDILLQYVSAIKVRPPRCRSLAHDRGCAAAQRSAPVSRAPRAAFPLFA